MPAAAEGISLASPPLSGEATSDRALLPTHSAFARLRSNPRLVDSVVDDDGDRGPAGAKPNVAGLLASAPRSATSEHNDD